MVTDNVTDGYEEVFPLIEYWNPKDKGEKIEGIYSRNYNDKNQKHRFVVAIGNKEYILPANMSIRDRMINVSLESKVMVIYDGLNEAVSGKKYQKYRIFLVK